MSKKEEYEPKDVHETKKAEDKEKEEARKPKKDLYEEAREVQKEAQKHAYEQPVQKEAEASRKEAPLFIPKKEKEQDSGEPADQGNVKHMQMPVEEHGDIANVTDKVNKVPAKKAGELEAEKQDVPLKTEAETEDEPDTA